MIQWNQKQNVGCGFFSTDVSSIIFHLAARWLAVSGSHICILTVNRLLCGVCIFSQRLRGFFFFFHFPGTLDSSHIPKTCFFGFFVLFCFLGSLKIHQILLRWKMLSVNCPFVYCSKSTWIGSIQLTLADQAVVKIIMNAKAMMSWQRNIQSNCSDVIPAAHNRLKPYLYNTLSGHLGYDLSRSLIVCN